jgi:hypothetical protein
LGEARTENLFYVLLTSTWCSSAQQWVVPDPARIGLGNWLAAQEGYDLCGSASGPILSFFMLGGDHLFMTV